MIHNSIIFYLYLFIDIKNIAIPGKYVKCFIAFFASIGKQAPYSSFYAIIIFIIMNYRLGEIRKVEKTLPTWGG
jgi:hypothetical protein